MPTARPRDAPRSFPGVPLKPWTYRTLAYNLLAVPLGFVYVLVLVTGAALTVGVGLTLAGPVFLLLTLLSVVALAHAAGRLTGGLLDVEVDPPFPDDGTAVGFLKQFVLGRATWAGVVYLLCRSVLWLVTFVELVVGLGQPARRAPRLRRVSRRLLRRGGGRGRQPRPGARRRRRRRSGRPGGSPPLEPPGSDQRRRRRAAGPRVSSR